MRVRLLLRLQADIGLLEDELNELDESHASQDDSMRRLLDWKEDRRLCEEEHRNGERTRIDLLEELESKISRYGKLSWR